MVAVRTAVLRARPFCIVKHSISKCIIPPTSAGDAVLFGSTPNPESFHGSTNARIPSFCVFFLWMVSLLLLRLPFFLATGSQLTMLPAPSYSTRLLSANAPSNTTTTINMLCSSPFLTISVRCSVASAPLQPWPTHHLVAARLRLSLFFSFIGSAPQLLFIFVQRLRILFTSSLSRSPYHLIHLLSIFLSSFSSPHIPHSLLSSYLSFALHQPQ